MSSARSSNAREKAARAWGQADIPRGEDAATAVVAHGLLGNLAVIRGATRMLLGNRDLDEAERQKLWFMLEAQVDLMQGVLADLVRELPSQALAALDELNTR